MSAPVLIPYARGVVPDWSLYDRYLHRPPGQVLGVGIEAIREVIRLQATNPRRSIAFDITNVTVAAQNALLKFLEDPPGDPDVVVYHDVSFQPLETIVSRCASSPLLTMTNAQKRDVLRAEGLNVDRQGIDWDYPIDVLRALLADERAMVTALLDAVAKRDAMEALKISAGFRRREAEVLGQMITSHLAGDPYLRVAAFSTVPPGVLSAWALALESVSPTLAVRWGVVEIITRTGGW